MKVEVTLLLKKVNALASAVKCYQAELRDRKKDGLAALYNQDQKVKQSLLPQIQAFTSSSAPSAGKDNKQEENDDFQQLSFLRKEWEEINNPTLKDNLNQSYLLLNQLLDILEKNKNAIPQNNWMGASIEVDDELFNAANLQIEKNKTKPNHLLETLIKIYDSSMELLENEKTFFNTCANLDTQTLEMIITDFYSKKKLGQNEIYRDPKKIGEIIHALNNLKEFKNVANYFELTLEEIIKCSVDISHFIFKFLSIFGNKKFSNLFNKLLPTLANIYVDLIHIINEINLAIQDENYEIPNEIKEHSFMKRVADSLSTPFQRIGRYELTYKNIFESLKKLINTNVKFSKETTTIEGEEVTLKTANRALENILKERAKNVNQKVKMMEPTVKQKSEKAQKELEEVNKGSVEFRLKHIEHKILRTDKQWKIRGCGKTYTYYPEDGERREVTVSNFMSKMLEVLYPQKGDYTFAKLHDDESINHALLLNKLIDIAELARDYRPSWLNFFYKRDPEVQAFFEEVAKIKRPDSITVEPLPETIHQSMPINPTKS